MASTDACADPDRIRKPVPDHCLCGREWSYRDELALAGHDRGANKVLLLKRLRIMHAIAEVLV